MTGNVSKIVPIVGCLNVPGTLRSIADEIESSPELQGHSVTLILNDRVYHMGTVDDARASEQAVWNMTFGIHKLLGVVTN
ncbi:MAG: hypothetical protein Q8N34_03420 [Gammaproteobacteria bacterium]|nr:hypothetical protein [Gammaproteobacteria bacterium]